MATYSQIQKQSSSSQRPFAVDFRQLPRQHLSKSELRAMAAEAFATTAAMKPVKKDGER